MAKIYTTEITSDNIPSDNPLHQRLFKAYVVAAEHIRGDVLEVGCGEGRGVELLMQKATSFTAVDKIEEALVVLRKRFPAGKFMSMNIPPIGGLADNAYDVVVSFQVIEHIKNDALYLKEINRVLKPGGIALLTTPNRKMSLSRNPWHIREYLAHELKTLAAGIFSTAEMKGITGNEKYVEGVSVGMDEVADGGFTIAPNPVADVLVVSGMPMNAQVEVIDAAGKSIMTDRLLGNDLDVSQLAPGVYQLRVIDGALVRVERFVKR